MPTRVLNNSSPHELLFNKPDYTHLKVFSCLCYAYNFQRNSKFDSRGIKCVLLGYPMGKKAYKLFDLEENKYIVNRDVLFFEDDFPFLHEHDNNHHVFPKVIDNSNFPSVLNDFLPLSDVPQNTVNDATATPTLLDNSLNHISPQPEPTIISPMQHNPTRESTFRQSTRHKRLPTHLNDYHMTSSSRYPLANYISSSVLCITQTIYSTVR